VNKFAQMFIIMIFLVMATLMVESLYLTTSADITTGILTDGAPGGIFNQIASVIKGFWKIITFQIPEMPVAINLLVFYPLSVMVFFMAIDLIRG
jgi:hypothetical protein